MSYESIACLYSGKIFLAIALISLPLPALSETKQLNLALEELAACVGLSSQATITLLEASNLNNE
ncbi:MAG: hypothetical protein V7K77_07555 [Nostoc sp.]|uniref:hypothetical protein n=1 Tax=Nostoc sp. TaxID=1180 RepID=UPI002FF688C5